jgi:hypothetical protein
MVHGTVRMSVRVTKTGDVVAWPSTLDPDCELKLREKALTEREQWRLAEEMRVGLCRETTRSLRRCTRLLMLHHALG